MKPIFIKGHLSFEYQGREFEFVHQSISIYGVTGLPWGPLDKVNSFGKQVTVNVRIVGKPALGFQCPATFTREQSLNAAHMGLRFTLDAVQKSALDARILSDGFYPTDYVRKYPRMPSTQAIQTFPLRALIRVPSDTSATATGDPFIFDLANLSPNGVLLMTQNQAALSLIPGNRVEMTLEPRGWFPVPVKAHGMICRLTDEIDPTSGNIVRYAGIKFTKVDDENRSAFLDLLKDILTRLKVSTPGRD